MARPDIIIDFKLVNKLLRAGCTGTEIAARIGCHAETLYKRVEKDFDMLFTDYAQEKRACGNASLHEAQYKKAVEKLDNTMLIWLGKQRLGQKDNDREKIVSEDVMKAFSDLMLQLAKAQEEPSVERSQPMDVVPPPRCVSLCISPSITSMSQFCRESPFR